MKKLLLSIMVLSGALLSWGQNGQIQNGGFENWTNQTLYDYPTTWNSSDQDQFVGTATVIKSTDAQIGTYSAEIRSIAYGTAPDTAFGYVFLGSTGSMGPQGGIPYSASFNTIKFQYKCDLPVTNDSVYIYMIRFLGGMVVDYAVAPVVGGTTPTWTQGSLTVSSIPQDELFIGFVMGDPNNGVLCAPGSWARFDNVQLFNGATAATTLPDYSFESWSSSSVETPDNWFTLNEILVGMGIQNAVKSTDAAVGTYSLELTTVQDINSGDTIPGILSAGPINVNSMGNPFGPAPYNASPTSLNCKYKHMPINGDQGMIQVQFFQGGNPIGNALMQFVTNLSWTNLSVPVTISGVPDSMVFLAFSGQNPGTVLMLDEISFSGGNVGLEEFAASNLSIYPNPAIDKVMVKLDGMFGYELINVYGTVVASASNVNNAIEIDLTQFTSGSYLIRLTNANATETHSLVIR
jgi:hypothetical protein